MKRVAEQMPATREVVAEPKVRSDRGAATRQAIVSTSAALFAERGYAATSMRQLAEQAGLPLSAVYYYFAGKYDLLLAHMDEGMRRLEEATEKIAEGNGDPVRKLAELVETHVRVHIDEPNVARVADGELWALEEDDRVAMIARRDRYEQRFRAVLEEGIEAGAFAADLRVPIASAAVITMSTAVIHWWKPDGPLSAEETAAVLGEYAVSLAAGTHLTARATID